MRGLARYLWVACAVLLFCAIPANAASTVHHDMDARLDIKERTLSVTDRITINGQGPKVFHLSARFKISSVTLDGKNAPILQKGDAWIVNLEQPGEHKITVTYKGTLSPLPKSPRDYAPNTPIASSEGSYLPESSGWRPSLGEDEFTYRLAIKVPAPHKAVALGRLVEEETQEGTYRAVFESTRPVRELLLLAGPYTIQEKIHKGIRLRTYFHKRIAALAGDYLDSTAAYIDMYSESIGDYPFPSFHIVSGPLPVGFGYAGLTYMGADVLRLPFIRHTSLGHEVLHNWWGNGVYIDYGKGNWAEGLTTFMADYAYALKKGPQEGTKKRLGWLRDYAALPPDRDQAVVDFVVKTHDASQVIGYNKVAFFFHMLRRQLGEDVFNAAIRRFWKSNTFKTASWKDIRQAFEAESNRPLKSFFNQWLGRVGAPKITLGTATVKAADNHFAVSFTLSQDGPVYALKVPIKVTTENGEQWFNVALESRQSSHEVFTNFRPTALSVDPNFDIFRRLDAAETPPILRDVTLKSNAVIYILSKDKKLEAAAQRLAQRLMDSQPNFETPQTEALPEAPLILMGTTAEIEAFLSAAKLAPTPAILAGHGSARVWAARRNGKWPLLIIAAKDAKAMESLLRPLPHYGRKSYLIFKGSRAVEHGTWPPKAGPLIRNFSSNCIFRRSSRVDF